MPKTLLAPDPLPGQRPGVLPITLLSLALLAVSCGPPTTDTSAPTLADRVTLTSGLECRMVSVEFDPALLQAACEQTYDRVRNTYGLSEGGQQGRDMLGHSTLVVTPDRLGLLYDVGNGGLFHSYTPADHSFLFDSTAPLGPAIATFQTVLVQELSNQGHDLTHVISSMPRGVVVSNERVNPNHVVVFDVDRDGEVVGDIHFDSGRGMVKIGEAQGDRMVLDPLYPRAWDAARMLGIDTEVDQPPSD